MSRSLRRLAAAATVVTVVVLVVRATRAARPTTPTTTNDVHVATARVQRTDLVATEQVDGALGYSAGPAVVDHLPGTYTAIPDEGTVVQPGQPLFSVDGQPVTLMLGTVPAWRDFAPGMTDGADVVELQFGLVTSGSAIRGMHVDGHYGWPTIAAVRSWRADHGLVPGDDLRLGTIAFLPGAVRVGQLTGQVGAAAEPGQAPYAATGTTRVVTIELDVARRGQVRAGQLVTVDLPSGASLPARVTSVGRVAHVAAAGNAPGGSQPSVTVIVTPASSTPIGDLDQTPVAVQLVTDRRVGVLAVPITALLARPGGGYGVEVADPRGSRRIVPIKPGLFSETMVEITGTGITDATVVVTAR